jgi:hypothetical protein
MTVMVPIRSVVAAAAVTSGLALAAATATPAPVHAIRPATHPTTISADQQLISALRVRMRAARARESVTLIAVEQRLRAIYAAPIQDPLTTLLTGDISGAQALSEITAAMAQSDRSLLFGFTTAVANLQTAQTELADNMLRATASARLAAARRAALQLPAAPPSTPPGAPTATTPAGPGGLPTSVIRQHTLPGAAPIDPRTGRPYPVSWSGQ